jgi:hypothetical protein
MACSKVTCSPLQEKTLQEGKFASVFILSCILFQFASRGGLTFSVSPAKK